MVVSERAVVSSRAAFGRPQGDPPRAAQLESDDYWISAGSSCMRCHDDSVDVRSSLSRCSTSPSRSDSPLGGGGGAEISGRADTESGGT